MKKITLLLFLLSFVRTTSLEAQITTFPYTEDFESGDGGWVADNTTNGSWALGTPAGTIINSAASGTNSWVTNLTGNYNSNEDSWVTSPVFDFSSLAAPSIEMSIWYDIEFSWDGAVLQSSIDGGATWVNVGANGDTNNWYTDDTIDGNPGDQQEGWSGTGAAGTNAWVTARHALTGLGGQSNVIFRIAFGSDGSVTDEGFGFDDINIFEVSCPEPTDLSATNFTIDGAELSWMENGSATLWNVEVVLSGDAPTGTPTATGVSNPYTVTGLLPNTTYDFYVQAECDPINLSSFSGPASFYTGYCESIPVSNNGEGVTNVTIGITDFPSLGDVTYENQTSPVVSVFQGVNTNVAITFATGFTYDTNIWIDFNDDLVFDNVTELVYSGESTNVNPTVLDASFVMPITAPIGQHRMRIGTADGGQVPPNPCYNGNWGVTLDFTVDIQQLTCTLPEASFTTNVDCDNDQFFIDVDVTSLGDATSLEISNDYDASTVQALATGVHQAGPFPFGNTVKIFVANEQDNNCTISSDFYEVLACPPDNDECASATVAFVNADESCDTTISGTILAATPSAVPSGSCFGDPNDDVWFEFTALGDQQIIEIQNITGGTTNLDHAVYEGDCNNLTEIYCSDDTFSLTPSLVVGNTYYIRVFSAGSTSETSTFDLCISTLGTPTYCLDALPICPDPNNDYPSIVGDQVAPPYLDYDCLGSQPDPQWNTIQFDTGGDYEFSLDQVDLAGNPIDIDFIIWGPFTDQQSGCVDLVTENIADCSFSATASETITLTNVPDNSIYVILITNYSQQEGFYNLTQDSGPVGGVNCDVVCDVTLALDGSDVEDDIDDPLTPDETFEFCGFESVELTASTAYAVDEYRWYQDGFLIPNYNQPNLTVTESGTYQVQVLGGICDQSETYFSALVDIRLFDESPNIDPQNITVCDDTSSDGVEEFDLDALTASLGLGADFTVSYYTNTADANQAINAVSSPYTTSGETLIIRIEDTTAFNEGFLGCRQLSEVVLTVNSMPVIGTPDNLIGCSVNDSDFFNLTDNDTAVLDGLTASDYTVSYHTSLTDADSNTGALTSPYSNTSNPQTIYVRLEDNVTGCYSTASFELIITAPTQIANSQDIALCDESDGFIDDMADFDLAAHTSVVLGTQDPASYNVTYHGSQADAENNANALPDLYTSGSATVYVRVENATSPDCYVVNSFNLTVLAVPQATFDPQYDYEVCPSATAPVTIGIIPDNFTAADVTVRWFLDDIEIVGASGLTLDTVLESGDYSAEMTFNATNCTNTITNFVMELDACIFPQGISPGVSPGQNDRFDLSSFDVVKLEIFNRYGTLVYSKNNYTDEWEGQTNDGEELPVGVYFYTVIYEGGEKQKSAWVYINR